MTTKLVFCYWGSGIALGIYGTKEQVTQTSNLLYNSHATDSKTMWLSEKPKAAFAYVLTDWEKLKKGYTDMFLASYTVAGKELERKRLGRSLKKVCGLKADAKIATIEPEPFLDEINSVVEPFKLGYIQFPDGGE